MPMGPPLPVAACCFSSRYAPQNTNAVPNSAVPAAIFRLLTKPMLTSASTRPST